jgi:hypothetical protein
MNGMTNSAVSRYIKEWVVVNNGSGNPYQIKINHLDSKQKTRVKRKPRAIRGHFFSPDTNINT